MPVLPRQSAAISSISRYLSTTTILRKKVSKHVLTDLAVFPDVANSLLSHVEMPTGSVVLDTVRKYRKKYPQCALLTQVGEFYELYEDHATTFAPKLGIKLTTKRIAADTIVDFAGFPARALDRYLEILVNELHCKVALCEQAGPVSRQDNTIVALDRKVTRVITPGTVIEEGFLKSSQYNYLLSIFPYKEQIGLAWVDVSVGEFVMQLSSTSSLKDDLARIRPREVILPESMRPSDAALERGLVDQDDAFDPITKLLMSDASIALSYQADQDFSDKKAMRTLNQMFKRFSANTLGFSQIELAAGMALMMYVNETHINRKPKWQMPSRFSTHDSVCIDSAAMASLELVKTLQGRRTDSLLSVLDCTSTSAGSRLLTQWISSPLTNVPDINRRLDVVEFFTQDRFLLDDIRRLLHSSTDAQRAITRLNFKKGQHTDLMEVWSTLDVIKSIHTKLQAFPPMQSLINDMDPHDSIAKHIQDAFDHEKIQSKEVRDYGFVNHAFHPALLQLHTELDQLEMQRLNLQNELRQLCGNSLSLLTDGSTWKHIIEVSSRQSSKLLERFPHAIPLQHTKSKKRYQIDEWTSISVRLEGVQSQIIQVENEVFEQVVDTVLDASATILQSCRKLAQLDVLTSFAQLAINNQYIRPRLTRVNRTLIQGGRHPVVESNLAKKGKNFTENDCDVGNKQRIWLLTGPNMGGKSTFLRQHVIIVLMAHMGCFVPANRAWIGVTDKIFSRVGAADNLAQNQSTFMVEMSEVSTILQHATAKSTVIMDEVGRGTSTKDGFSLAFGILDYLHNKIKCRTIFATHFHELADTVQDYQHLKCYRTGLEMNEHGNWSFVHKVEPGVCRESHGIKVAQLAGTV
ncbi:aspartate--tRNA ligase msd1 [Mucor velutinosus]|uniref:Aspartate--tRNA ligase msd1 n=1 Tax=Mucor velutinosus TaxID=708070 RepID=A0AAN7I395_9FUNG|nr:aspartate--tRNA ligase msd1 [Mucor velutinosus]